MVTDLFQGRGFSGGNEKRGSRPRDEIIEKNYFFVKSSDLPNIDLKEPAQEKTYFGKIRLTLTALQDIFVGSGEVEEHNQRLYDSFSYVKNEPGKPDKTFTLPGSSMKGCILTNLLLFLKESSIYFYSASTRKDSDDMAKVFFSDFPVISGGDSNPQTIPGRFNPRIEPPDNTRLKMYCKDDLAYANLSKDEWQALQSKENILTIKKGCRFKGFINFKLLSLHQLLFLVLSLGCLIDHRFCFKVGGAKNRGMGLVKMDMDIEKSFYANGLKELSLGKERSMKELEPQLISALSQLKQQYTKIDTAIKIMQKEYGVPS